MQKVRGGRSREHAYAATRRREDGILMTEMVGKATGQVVQEMAKDVLTFWRDDADRVWLVDTRNVPGFTSDLPGPAADFLNKLRARGKPTIVAIITNMAVRMMGRTLCFGAGIKLVAVEKPAQADEAIRSLMAPASG